jgi:hypothetical protein
LIAVSTSEIKYVACPYRGWAFKITHVWGDSLSLSDEVWGVRLSNVRLTSVRLDPLAD